MSGSRVVNYALAGFRYLVTGTVAMLLALLLVLLIVEVGAVIGAAFDHDKLASRNWGESAMWANSSCSVKAAGNNQAKAMTMSR